MLLIAFLVFTFAVEAHGRVECGGHYAPTCADCPRHMGADWCHGACQWCNGACELKEDCANGGSVMFANSEGGRCLKGKTSYGHFKFIGFGYYYSHSTYRNIGERKLENCIKTCENVYKSDHSWNGLFFKISSSYCACVKGDSGHHAHGNYLHYRWK